MTDTVLDVASLCSAQPKQPYMETLCVFERRLWLLSLLQGLWEKLALKEFLAQLGFPWS